MAKLTFYIVSYNDVYGEFGILCNKLQNDKYDEHEVVLSSPLTFLHRKKS